jgi:hypothetical protein
MLLDGDGNYVWDSKKVEVCSLLSYKGEYVVSDFLFDNHWLTFWEEERLVEPYDKPRKIYMQRVNFDGTLGDNGVCLKPINVTVNNITYKSAVVSWNGSYKDYELSYRIVDEEWNSIDVIDSKTYCLENLEKLTDYQVRIRSKNSDAVSEWSDIISFSTTNSGYIKNSNKETLTVFYSDKMISIINPDNIYIERVQLVNLNGILLSDYVVNNDCNMLIPVTINEKVAIVKIIGQKEYEIHKILIK